MAEIMARYGNFDQGRGFSSDFFDIEPDGFTDAQQLQIIVVCLVLIGGGGGRRFAYIPALSAHTFAHGLRQIGDHPQAWKAVRCLIGLPEGPAGEG